MTISSSTHIQTDVDEILLNAAVDFDVVSWRFDGIDIWPLFLATISGLALHLETGYSRGVTRVGSKLWQAYIRASYRLGPALKSRHRPRFAATPELEGKTLSNSILQVGTRQHGRTIGTSFVIPPLDVPSLALRGAGHKLTRWIIDAGADDLFLSRLLHQPSYGVSGMMRCAQRGATTQEQSLHKLGQLPGLRDCLVQVGQVLRLDSDFLMLWFARQVDLMRSAFSIFGEIFDSNGPPKKLIIVAGGYWWSAGLCAAARARGVQVVEIEHGAERPSAITAAVQRQHFSIFNSAPGALVSWSTIHRNDNRFLAVGPIGNMLPELVSNAAEPVSEALATLRETLHNQEGQLQERAVGYRREVLISSDDAQGGAWVADIVAKLPKDTFCWIRRHPREGVNSVPGLQGLDARQYDVDLASGVPLPLLLARVDVHVTRFSAVALEAAAMGVPTIATHPYAAALFGPHVDSDLLTLATSHEDLVATIATLPHRSLATKAGERSRISPRIEALIDFLTG